MKPATPVERRDGAVLGPVTGATCTAAGEDVPGSGARVVAVMRPWLKEASTPTDGLWLGVGADADAEATTVTGLELAGTETAPRVLISFHAELAADVDVLARTCTCVPCSEAVDGVLEFAATLVVASIEPGDRIDVDAPAVPATVTPALAAVETGRRSPGAARDAGGTFAGTLARTPTGAVAILTDVGAIDAGTAGPAACAESRWRRIARRADPAPVNPTASERGIRILPPTIDIKVSIKRASGPKSSTYPRVLGIWEIDPVFRLILGCAPATVTLLRVIDERNVESGSVSSTGEAQAQPDV